jgi:hypothetical protein
MPKFQLINNFLAEKNVAEKDKIFEKLLNSRAEQPAEKNEIIDYLFNQLAQSDIAPDALADLRLILGVCYLHGDAVLINYNQALKYFKLSANSYSVRFVQNIPHTVVRTSSLSTHAAKPEKDSLELQLINAFAATDNQRIDKILTVCDKMVLESPVLCQEIFSKYLPQFKRICLQTGITS